MLNNKTFIEIDNSEPEENDVPSEIVESKGKYGNHLIYSITKNEEDNKYYGVIARVLENFVWDEYSEEELTNLLRKHYFAIKTEHDSPNQN